MKRFTWLFVVGLPLAGCNTAEDPRLEGVALDAGDAIARNSALQIIDPWPANVQDTNLKVPAVRAGEVAGDDTPPLVLAPSTLD